LFVCFDETNKVLIVNTNVAACLLNQHCEEMSYQHSYCPCIWLYDSKRNDG